MNDLWTHKYRPKNRSDLIGNERAINTLYQWLSTWERNYKEEIKERKAAREAKGKKVRSKSTFKRAILISGPPGIGKTSSAQVACADLGFHPHEMNASDVRSKGSLQEHVRHLADNRTMSNFFGTGGATATSLSCIIMDEVDGMSSGDRGGMRELTAIIATTRVPIVCICNDDEKQSVRTLAGYCEIVNFHDPNPDRVTQRVLQLVQREGLQAAPELVKLLVQANKGDIRQVLRALQTWAAEGNKSASEITASAKKQELTVLESVGVALSRSATLSERKDAYFKDMGMVPFFMFDNYLRVLNSTRSQMHPLGASDHISESMSFGELLQAQIGATQNYGLAPHHAMASTVVPGMALAYRSAQPITSDLLSFPYDTLGKISRQNKQTRVVGEIAQRMSAAGTPCTRTACATDLIGSGVVYSRVFDPIAPWKTKTADDIAAAVDETLAVMDDLGLTREDLDTISCNHLAFVKGVSKPDVQGKVMAAVTRKYNKRSEEYTQKRKKAAVKGLKRAK